MNDRPPVSYGTTLAARGREAVSAVLRETPRDVVVDARSVVGRCPEIRDCKSAYLDLAYEEFCRRREAGEDVDPSEFASRFPSIRHSLVKLVEVDGFLQANPELLRSDREIDWPREGDKVVGFRLVERLGAGMLSRVFLARESALDDRLVVVKVSPAASSEPRTLARLDHPSIVPVFSVRADADRGLSVMCMPYRTRATLLDVLDAAFGTGGGLSAERGSIARAVHRANLVDDALPRTRPNAGGDYLSSIVGIAIGVADALAFAHTRRVLHCDVKPSNVLLTPDGLPLVADFNLAVVDAAPRAGGGTLPYMAPEQLRAVIDQVAAQVDERTDVFGLGATLYELLRGRLPFGDRQTGETLEHAARRLRARQASDPVRVDEFESRIDRRLAAIVASCLAFDETKRPGSAAELARSLRDWRAHRRRRALRRNAGVASAAGVLVLGASLWGWTRPSPSDARPAADGAERVTATTSLRSAVERANAAFSSADYDEAERAYADALAFDDESLDEAGLPRARLELRRALCLARLDRPHAASDVLRGAWERVDAAHRDGRFELVAEAWEQGLAFEDDLLEASGTSRGALENRLAYALIAIGRRDEALAVLENSDRLQDVPSAIQNLGLLSYDHVVRVLETPDGPSEAEILRAVARMKSAIVTDADRGDLRLLGARLYAIRGSLFPSQAPNARRDAVNLAKGALARGVPPSALSILLTDWPDLAELPEFRNVRPPETGSPAESPSLKFVDPVRAASEPAD